MKANNIGDDVAHHFQVDMSSLLERGIAKAEHTQQTKEAFVKSINRKRELLDKFEKQGTKILDDLYDDYDLM